MKKTKSIFPRNVIISNFKYILLKIFYNNFQTSICVVNKFEARLFSFAWEMSRQWLLRSGQARSGGAGDHRYRLFVQNKKKIYKSHASEINSFGDFVLLRILYMTVERSCRLRACSVLLRVACNNTFKFLFRIIECCSHMLQCHVQILFQGYTYILNKFTQICINLFVKYTHNFFLARRCELPFWIVISILLNEWNISL